MIGKISPKKAIIVCLDGPVVGRVEKYVNEGKLPTISKLIQNGVFAENNHVPYPTVTAQNWNVISTGATIGTHGIASFTMILPDEPLSKAHQAWTSEYCNSEYLWEAAARGGKKSVVINWHACWPARTNDVIQLGGSGMSINEWRWEPKRKGELRIELHPPFTPLYMSLCDNQLYTTEEFPWSSHIELMQASGWQNTPNPDESYLEAEINFSYPKRLGDISEKKWYILVENSQQNGFDKVHICKSKDLQDEVSSMYVKEWSNRIVESFETPDGLKDGAFKIKLLELSKDGNVLTLFFTPICALDGLHYYPEGVSKELKKIEIGLPTPTYGPFQAVSLGWIDDDTWYEIEEMEHEWYAEAAKVLMENHDWSLLFVGDHTHDYLHHVYFPQLRDYFTHIHKKETDPNSVENKEILAKFEKLELKLYQSVDKMISKVMEKADDSTVVVVVSDHGAKPYVTEVPVVKILRDAGLLVVNVNEETGDEVIDWSKTKALPYGSYVYVNHKGRPDGIVEEGEEYEHVRDEIIKAFYDYTDKESGKKPFTIALRREDARVIGLKGDRVGDVIFAVGDEFAPPGAGEHGKQLSTSNFGFGDIKGLLIMSGPGFKKNYRLERTVTLTDIVPTLCHLLEIPVPKDTEGGIIYQALEDPDQKLNEHKRVKTNYERVLKAAERQSSLTHGM